MVLLGVFFFFFFDYQLSSIIMEHYFSCPNLQEFSSNNPIPTTTTTTTTTTTHSETNYTHNNINDHQYILGQPTLASSGGGGEIGGIAALDNYSLFGDQQGHDHDIINNINIDHCMSGFYDHENLFLDQYYEPIQAVPVSDVPDVHVHVVNNNNINNERMMLPSGFRFCPYDIELIRDYLMKKIAHPQLNWDHIKQVQLYDCDPSQLAACYPNDEGEWYFFTERDKRYPNGERPNRSTRSGYWKATGARRKIVDNEGIEIGNKRPLVFYQGKHKDNRERSSKEEPKKTDWIMYEYQVHDPTTTTSNSNRRKRDEFENTTMRLDG
ncbi:hypothetical protein M9H77_14054 [Catharanthus roseus]|uniref:Uncharacterized protein n=2 Tax=Catharanthus roseus TaxID=4058 RepID=A0ACC0BM21_CATRO|nr:hypothetical protein M9H77_14050 [Catharanthus roseus]KAI5673690.1 hypothetical protein M9H77_14054 [Catharanthus roseus]